MQKSILSFWQHQENLPEGHADRLPPRICRLLQEVFEKWHTKPRWLAFDQLGHLFDYFKNDELAAIMQLPVIRRKGLAVKKTFEVICSDDVREAAGTMEVNASELLVGTSPPFSVGQGKELMRYLTQEETLVNELRYFNEWSPFGHIVPNHEAVLQKGIMGMIEDCQQRIAQTGGAGASFHFYQSVINCLEGVLYYANAYADMCGRLAQQYHPVSEEYKNLMTVSDRLRKVPAQPAETFAEALQTILIMHCALHFTGEITPIGRLDQLLIGYYRKETAAGTLTPAGAQELLDCFWIKLDEKAVQNRRLIQDRFTSSDGALLGSGGPSNFDQGALVNQWMQQITIGGVLADNDAQATDATNELTYMCLACARRLPLNSPTLDLRVHSRSEAKLLKAAAEAILSGGAHPVLMNDDKLIPALLHKTGGTVELKSARNYACDGCFETLFAGETEFSFGFVSALDVLEKALNSGAGFAMSGGTYLRGTKGSYRTPEAASITSFEMLLEIMERHIMLGCHKFLNGILMAYGSKEGVSPSPLLSAMITGCIEKGRDISGGGARYRLFSPLMTGISTAVDSLHVIKKLVFTEKLFTLQELVSCLRCNWGRSPEVVGLKLSRERIEEIRNSCRGQAKFGQGVAEVDELAWNLVQTFYNCMDTARQHPIHAAAWQKLRDEYGTPDYPFEILFAPGVGTFEQFNFGGSFVGATPDGRFAFDPIASDMSPAPLHSDEAPASRTEVKFMDGLKSYAHEAINLLSDGAPPDFNIREDFDVDALTDILIQFAQGHGSNMLTVTVSNPETMQAAQENPDDYDLLRVRMGGWTEFFICLFPPLQEQHKRRPLFTH